MTNEEIVSKFRTLVSPLIEKGRREQIDKLVLGLERIDDTSELAALLSGSLSQRYEGLAIVYAKVKYEAKGNTSTACIQ